MPLSAPGEVIEATAEGFLIGTGPVNLSTGRLLSGIVGIALGFGALVFD